MKLVINIPKEMYKEISLKNPSYGEDFPLYYAIRNGTPITPDVLADTLMEERIRGKLDSDTIFEKDIIQDVKCRLTVSIIDHRPCYCGAELREAWRESDDKEGEQE